MCAIKSIGSTDKLAPLRELKIFENVITNVPNILTFFPEMR